MSEVRLSRREWAVLVMLGCLALGGVLVLGWMVWCVWWGWEEAVPPEVTVVLEGALVQRERGWMVENWANGVYGDEMCDTGEGTLDKGVQGYENDEKKGR